jgi:hypothetical protein
MLTEKQKQIAWDAFYAAMNTGELTLRKCAHAAVEAVLAEQERAAEQPNWREIHNQFHKLWSASVGTENYDKDQWNKMDSLLSIAQRPIEQERAAEQGQACADCGCWIKMGTHCAPCYSRNAAPIQSPAGDVVERMCYVYCMNNPATGIAADRGGMSAALQVAREGYVSLDDVEKAITYALGELEIECEPDNTIFMDTVRARLAKPAEQQPEHVLEIESRHSDYGQDAGGYSVLRFGGAWIGRIDNREAAQKLVDYVIALKGEQK